MPTAENLITNASKNVMAECKETIAQKLSAYNEQTTKKTRKLQAEVDAELKRLSDLLQILQNDSRAFYTQLKNELEVQESSTVAQIKTFMPLHEENYWTARYSKLTSNGRFPSIHDLPVKLCSLEGPRRERRKFKVYKNSSDYLQSRKSSKVIVSNLSSRLKRLLKTAESLVKKKYGWDHLCGMSRANAIRLFFSAVKASILSLEIGSVSFDLDQSVFTNLKLTRQRRVSSDDTNCKLTTQRTRMKRHSSVPDLSKLPKQYASWDSLQDMTVQFVMQTGFPEKQKRDPFFIENFIELQASHHLELLDPQNRKSPELLQLESYLEKDEKLKEVYDCTLLSLKGANTGKFLIGSNFLYFVEKSKNCSNNNKLRHKKWPFNSVKFIHLRRYLLQHTALEFFYHVRKPSMLVFDTNGIRDRVFNSLRAMDRSGHIIFVDQLMMEKAINTMSEKWSQGKLSNFEYILNLNTFAGRTYNDLTQYPVFPWVLKDYESSTLDLKDPKIYRDFSKPMGAQTLERLQHFKDKELIN
ncbi:uncharacterized protein LOC135141118 [Zophobas morio]|uniref:uncharacterized protein LOC135141118 n=1 Tax=Zophobas morio TaxID=2755281 RepID=UPI0030827CB8